MLLLLQLDFLRNEKSLRLIIMILTLYVKEKLPTVVRKLPGKNKINSDEKNLQHKLLEISLFLILQLKVKLVLVILNSFTVKIYVTTMLIYNIHVRIHINTFSLQNHTFRSCCGPTHFIKTS